MNNNCSVAHVHGAAAGGAVELFLIVGNSEPCSSLSHVHAPTSRVSQRRDNSRHFNQSISAGFRCQLKNDSPLGLDFFLRYTHPVVMPVPCAAARSSACFGRAPSVFSRADKFNRLLDGASRCRMQTNKLVSWVCMLASAAHYDCVCKAHVCSLANCHARPVV